MQPFSFFQRTGMLPQLVYSRHMLSTPPSCARSSEAAQPEDQPILNTDALADALVGKLKDVLESTLAAAATRSEQQLGVLQDLLAGLDASIKNHAQEVALFKEQTAAAYEAQRAATQRLDALDGSIGVKADAQDELSLAKRLDLIAWTSNRLLERIKSLETPRPVQHEVAIGTITVPSTPRREYLDSGIGTHSGSHVLHDGTSRHSWCIQSSHRSLRPSSTFASLPLEKLIPVDWSAQGTPASPAHSDSDEGAEFIVTDLITADEFATESSTPRPRADDQDQSDTDSHQVLDESPVVSTHPSSGSPTPTPLSNDDDDNPLAEPAPGAVHFSEPDSSSSVLATPKPLSKDDDDDPPLTEPAPSAVLFSETDDSSSDLTSLAADTLTESFVPSSEDALSFPPSPIASPSPPLPIDIFAPNLLTATPEEERKPFTLLIRDLSPLSSLSSCECLSRAPSPQPKPTIVTPRTRKRKANHRLTAHAAKRPRKKSPAKAGMPAPLPLDIVWPVKAEEEDVFCKTFVQCDRCHVWYHCGCVGISIGDIRLEPTEIYICPACDGNSVQKVEVYHDSDLQRECARPDCDHPRQDEYFVERIVGRAPRLDRDPKDERYTETQKYVWLVKWDRYPITDATWETDEQMGDPLSLVSEFNKAAKEEGLDLASESMIVLWEAEQGGWKAAG